MQVTGEMRELLDQSEGAIGKVECLEISHPKWSQVYHFQITSNEDLVLTHEDGQSYNYEYAQMTITKSTDSETLEQEINFFFGDLGEVVPNLIDAFINDEEFDLPVVTYRAYIMGKYDSPLFVARGLEIDNVTRDWQGARADAKAPSLNEYGNGGVYNATDDPSLKGFY